jgi:hypothetical protein
MRLHNFRSGTLQSCCGRVAYRVQPVVDIAARRAPWPVGHSETSRRGSIVQTTSGERNAIVPTDTVTTCMYRGTGDASGSRRRDSP